MKFKLPILACVALAAMHLGTPRAHAQAANDRVRIEGRVTSDQDRKDIKGTSADTITQHKTLEISISGKPKSPETRTGKWMIYGHSAEGHDVTVIDSGDFKIELPANGPQKITSKKVSTTYTPEHSVVSGGGGGRGRAPKAKKVEGEGIKYAGYGVVIKDGDKIVGEYYDPPGVKAEAAK
jgi:hypothetical protein